MSNNIGCFQRREGTSTSNETSEEHFTIPPIPYLISDYFRSKTSTQGSNPNNTINQRQHKKSLSNISNINDLCTNSTNNKEPNKAVKKLIQQRLLAVNNVENKRWGAPITVKSKQNSRIYFQNINGLRFNHKQYNKWQECCSYMKETQSDIFGFAETCIDWNTKNIKHNFHQKCRKEFPSSSISYSNNKFPFTSTYLPGGRIKQLSAIGLER